jgi:hypothetical protein
LRITGAAFGEVAQILKQTLLDAGMDTADVDRVMATVAGAREAIVAD